MPSPYIENIKDWKIREMTVGYLEAKATFERYNDPFDDEDIISFKVLKEICDILYEAKENYHLIFKKILDPKKWKFETANKFMPDNADINFMNNMGLLFHKVLVARELKYILDYYEEDTTSYQETRASLERNLHRIATLFKQGIAILCALLATKKNNIYLITYFLENQDFCTTQFNSTLESLLSMLTDEDGLEIAYLNAAKFYTNSGWYDKAENMCRKSLELNPNNEQARLLLSTIK